MPENNEEKEFCVKYQRKKDSKILKIVIIAVMLLLLIIPIASISSIVSDRINYREDAISNIAKSWASQQLIFAPQMYFITKNKKNEKTCHFLELNNYDTEIKINTHIRKRGIFSVPVYTAEVTQKGDFRNTDFSLIDRELITEIDITDNKGFVTEPSFKINNGDTVKSNDLSFKVKLNKNYATIPFEISYKINGIKSIGVVLAGNTNNVKIEGNWATPSFKGDFLPNERNIANDGFVASWKVPQIALSSNSKAEVELFTQNDNYSMTEKVLKYAFLLLLLTFCGFFVFEIISDKKYRIHPIQYCLLGGAMLIFYLLLLSISEFFPFLYSYIISSILITNLIFLYTYFVLTKKQHFRFSIGISSLILALFAFFYIILKLQDIALITTSIGLFIIISAIMFLTRNVEWYKED